MTPEEKWDFLRDAPANDARNPLLRRVAFHLWAAAFHNPWRFATLAQSVARDWIRQVTDTARVGGEDIAGFTRLPQPDDAIDALKRGEDDCDAKSRLFVALCLAVGIPANVVPWWTKTDPPDLSHVSAEVLLGGKWRPVELTLSRARLDELGTVVPVEKADGKWKLS
jgi:transglutaminase-like putative cysteine protease